jgi:hypothetical protein
MIVVSLGGRARVDDAPHLDHLGRRAHAVAHHRPHDARLERRPPLATAEVAVTICSGVTPTW